MCGIAGQIDFNSQHNLVIREKNYLEMQKTLSRRGPDQRGVWLEEDVALIHARLAVVDLEGGRQPMTWREGSQSCTLVYNGELYNTEVLRSDLEKLGHTFREQSDTEVLLHSYLQWGADCVHRLNGIFAFAIWNEQSRTLFLARDRIGVKPLFYSLSPTFGLLFGSEIKALLAHPQMDAQLDGDGISELLFMGPGRTPGQGVFRNILELPPATCAHYSPDGFSTHRYWKLTDGSHTETFDETVEKTRYLVLDAIKSQLVSDVPVCTFLSGGVDSSVISAVANGVLRNRGEELHTFSVDYKENDRYFTASKFQPNSDNYYIQQMNEALGCQHHTVLLDSVDVADALFAATEARDLPGMADVDSSLLLFCRAVKPQATVALSGECADEIFGGYPWYRDKDIREQQGFPWAQSTAYRQSFLSPALQGKLDGASYVSQRYHATIADADVLPDTSPLERRMKEMMALNFQWFMQTLLDRKDRMSMYNGLEVRVPFCDYRIAEYLYTVPWKFKDYQGREKGLLRHAMEGVLPQEVLWRKKSPYPKTHHPVYLETVSGMLRDILRQKDAPIFQMIDRTALENLLVSNTTTPWYGQLMTTPQTIAYFVQLNHWLRHYKVQVVC